MNALLVAIIFFSIKIIENKFQKDDNEVKPLKQIVKDTLVVYVCCISGSMIYKQFFPSGAVKGGASAFVNNPDF
jgi:hypothetical protein